MNSLSCLYLNARSVRNKLTDLEIIQKSDKHDFIFITETWLKESDLDTMLVDPSNYGVIRNDRTTHAGGVAAIYNRKCADKIVTHSIDTANFDFEMLCFDLHFSSHRILRFICVYLPPHGSRNVKTVSNLIKILKKYMQTNEVYLIGDFNFHDHKWDQSTSHKWDEAKDDDSSLCTKPLSTFLNYLEEHNLHQLVTSPTRDENTLDLVITSMPQNISKLEVLHPLTSTCDHNMIEFQINTRYSNHNHIFQSPKRNFYLANYEVINAHLSTIDWDSLLVDDEIDQMYERFLDAIHNSIMLYVPLCKPRHKTLLPKEIRSLLKQKHVLYKKSKTDTSFKTAYKEHEKLYKIAVRKYKLDCENKIITSNSKKVLYNHINKKLHSRHSIPPLKQTNDEICLDPTEKANLLNNTFAQVFLNENTSTPIPNLTSTNTHITPNIMSPITYLDIANSIYKMNNSVSQTPDSIPAMFVKKTSSQLLRPLFMLFNKSINTSQVPKLWKKSYSDSHLQKR